MGCRRFGQAVRYFKTGLKYAHRILQIEVTVERQRSR